MLGAREREEMGVKKARHVAKATMRMESPGALKLVRLRGPWFIMAQLGWRRIDVESGVCGVAIICRWTKWRGRAEADDADVAKAIVDYRLTVVGPTYGQAVWLDRSWLPSTISANINRLREQVVARGFPESSAA